MPMFLMLHELASNVELSLPYFAHSYHIWLLMFLTGDQYEESFAIIGITQLLCSFNLLVVTSHSKFIYQIYAKRAKLVVI